MHKNYRLSRIFVLLVGATILFSLTGTLVAHDIAVHIRDTEYDELNEEEALMEQPIESRERGTRGTSPRVVLAELFTNYGCGPCTYANPPMNDLLDVYDRSQLVMVAYHMSWPSSNDPFYKYNEDENNEARYYYGVNSVPRIFFDGPPGYGHDGSTTYSYYKGFIDSEMANLSPMIITVDGFVYGSTGNVTAEIEVTDPLPAGNLKVRFAVVEDNRYASGPNGEVRHRYVMRNMLATEDLPALGVGATYTVSREFPINGTYDPESISIVVFVQNDSNQDVLQAGYHDFIPDDVLVIDDDEDAHPHGSEDTYHEILTYLGYSFDGWAMDERGGPSESDLAPYDTVIWLTGSTTTTLTASDQTAIAGYLDNGKGSLFITGENIGADIGTTPFFANYLSGLYISNLTGETQVNGVQFDPITDPYFGSPLPIVDNTPDWVIPQGNASGIFTYTSSGYDAGFRVQHDVDSRLVYFTFLYFEGTDSFDDKAGVLYKILNWAPVKIDDIIFRDAPGEAGNVLGSIISLDVDQSITVWAAAYNNTHGFLGNYGTTTWAEDSKGAIISVSSPGPSTIIQAGLVSDSVTLEARCFVYMNTTTVTVNPPGVDYIEIWDGPGMTGSEVSTIGLNVGMDVELWAAGFNVTTGYVADVDATVWTEDSGGSLITLTTPGSSTVVSALMTGGVCNVTASFKGVPVEVQVTINEATPDYIMIRDAPNDGGYVLATRSLNVGESLELWAAAYNDTSGWIYDYPATVWTEDSLGTVITLSPPTGASTVIHGGLDGGVAIVTAYNNGLQNSTEITVNEPTGDYIQIRDAANNGGNVVENPTYPVGGVFYYWGAVYNNTAGYLNDVPSYALWSSDNMDVVKVAAQGKNTLGEISDTNGGTALITLSVNGLYNSTTVTVLTPAVDYLLIRDAPEDGGFVVDTREYEVGENETLYTASYNDTAGYLGDVLALWGCDDISVGSISIAGTAALFEAVGIGSCIITVGFGALEVGTGIITAVDTTDPVAIIGSDFEIDEDATAYFDASDSRDNSEIVYFNWSFGDGSTDLGSETAPDHEYTEPGIYTVTLVITDAGGNTDTARLTVTVKDITSPTAVIGLRDTVEEDEDCRFNGSGSTDNVGIVTYTWEFGDGTGVTGTLANVLHAYDSRGTYTVNLTVTDAANNTHSATTTIAVMDTTPPSVPSGLVVTQVATGGVLIVSWEPVSDDDLSTYELYCSENQGDFVKLDDLDSDVTSYTHDGLDNGVSYRYYVVAVDFAGNPSPDSYIITGVPDTDTDGDGTFDLLDKDDDNDGLSDIKEAQAGSDPLIRDSDGDSYIDGEDAFPVNPKEWEDSDSDGYGDAHEDAFPRDPDEWTDSDGDGIGDNSDFIPINNILFFIIIIAVIAAVLVVFLVVRKSGEESVEFSDYAPAAATPQPPPASEPAPPPPPWMTAQKMKDEEPAESRELPPPPAKKEAPAPAGVVETKESEPAENSAPPPSATKPRPPRPPAAKGGTAPRPPRPPKKAEPKEKDD